MTRIAIHSVPRSGSSWVGQIFNSSQKVIFKFQPLFSYAFKNYLSESSSKEKIELFFELISKSEDPFLNQQDKVEKGIYPTFKKNMYFEHIVYKEVRYHHLLENIMKLDSDVFVVGIVRNPYAVINSFLQSPREFRRDLGWDELSEWRYANKKNLGSIEEYFGYEKWKEVFFLFDKLKEQYPNRFYLLYYDDLLKDVCQEVKKLFGFCGIEKTEQTKEFLVQSRKINYNDAYSVYKKIAVDDNWKRKLNPVIIKDIEADLINNNLMKYFI